VRRSGEQLDGLRILLALITASLVGSAMSDCGTETSKPAPVPQPETWQRSLTYPLVGFSMDDPERVAFSPNTRAEAIELRGRRQRVITSNGNGFVTLKRDDLPGSTLDGSYGLLPPAKEGTPERATFRIVAREREREEPIVTVLLEAEVTTGAIVPFRVEVPAELRPPVSLRLEVDYALAEPLDRRSYAVWVEPVLRKTLEDPVATRAGARSVVLITIDTLRQDVLGTYGGPIATPGFDALARDGIVLSNAHSAAYGTAPSHGSLMTGTYADTHGVYDNHTVFGGDALMLAEFLRGYGYSTAAFVGAAPVARGIGLAQGFDLFGDGFVGDASSGLGWYGYHQRRAPATVDLFERWLRDRPAAPFFVWIHLFDPHQPYSPLPGYADAYLPDPAGAGVEGYFVSGLDTPKYVDATEIADRDAEQLPAVEALARALYSGQVVLVDEQLNRIRSLLEEYGLYDETLVFVTSDHGEHFLERGPRHAFDHGTLYDEVTRLATIVKAPGRRFAGTRTDVLVSNIDFAPSIADLIGFAVSERPASWAGKSFVSLLPGADHPATGRAAAVFRDHLILEGAHGYEIGVRTDHWLYRRLHTEWQHDGPKQKYLGYRQGTPPFLLFDLAADPEARNNVFAYDHPAAVRLEQLLTGFIERHSDKRKTQDTSQVSERHREALRALGYVE